MPDVNDPTHSSQDITGCDQGGRESLTDAQRDFAKLLGRLLAQRWREEQRGKEEPLSSEKSN